MLDRIPRPVQILAILAIFAFGAALGANALIAKLLTPPPEQLAAARAASPGIAVAAQGGDAAAPEATGGTAPQPVATRSPGGRELVDYFLRPITARNIFDSSATNMPPKASTGPIDGEVNTKSSLDATLISTMEAADSKWSTALIAVSGSGPSVYMIGDQLLTAKVHMIHRPVGEKCARVILSTETGLEYISACDDSKTSRKPVANKDAKKKKKKKGGRHKYSIEDKGNGRYEVPQSDIDYALGNLDKLSREARVVPNFADGSPNGFKVFSIRRTSALRQMGIKNNDVLTAVNGFSLSNTEKALEIYGKLQSEKSFSLEVLRNGEPMTLEYEVR